VWSVSVENILKTLPLWQRSKTGTLVGDKVEGIPAWELKPEFDRGNFGLGVCQQWEQ